MTNNNLTKQLNSLIALDKVKEYTDHKDGSAFVGAMIDNTGHTAAVTAGMGSDLLLAMGALSMSIVTSTGRSIDEYLEDLKYAMSLANEVGMEAKDGLE